MTTITPRIAAAINDSLDRQTAEAVTLLLDDDVLHLVADPDNEDVYGLFEGRDCVAILYLQHSDVCRAHGIACDIETSDAFDDLLDELDGWPASDEVRR